MKTLQEQYNLINKGKGHKGVFMNEAKRLFPNIVPNSSTFKHLPKNIGSLIDPHNGFSLSSLPKKKFPSRYSNLAAIPV